MSCIYFVYMATELITFKMEQDFLNEVDKTVKISGYQSRTEFIRSALREKINELKLKQAIISLGKLKGASKIKTTDKDRIKAREKVFAELDKLIK